MRQWNPGALTVAALALISSCDQPPPRSAQPMAVRDTLDGGTVVVRYAELPDSATWRASPELRIGSLDGDPALTFGDIRGIDAAVDGTIYVLDFQASEIRSFAPDGRFLQRIATEGEGPGEITEANGMLLHGDTLLWLQDHGKWQMLAIDRDGTELMRRPMPVLRYGYIWSGTVDAQGRVWTPVSYTDEERRPFPPELGFHEGTSRSYMVSVDLMTEERDSIFLGTESYRTHVSRSGRGGYVHQGVPFTPTSVAVVDPDGGMWFTRGGDYRIIRLDEVGDTVIVIEADFTGPPVTAENRSEFVSGIVERDESRRAAAEALAEEAPPTKPAISGMLIDDLRQLWVRRGGSETSQPHYDVFTRDGTYQGSVALAFDPSQYLPLRVRAGNMYALVPDELGVPFVVRAKLEN